ncbi:MAG: hypothetical protein ACFFDY_00475 [Candidatus Thorarchaeota archaeon]
MDKFSQLVEDLNNNKLCLRHIQNAIRVHIRGREDLPKEIKDLLVGKEGFTTSSGFVYQIFVLLEQIMSSLDLAYRRGRDGFEIDDNFIIQLYNARHLRKRIKENDD